MSLWFSLAYHQVFLAGKLVRHTEWAVGTCMQAIHTVASTLVDVRSV